MAVLGKYVFTAEHDSVESEEALQDPLSPKITLANDFLQLFPSSVGHVLTDMHFVVRDRMGRLVAFMANAIHRGWTPRGFAANEKTAVLLSPGTGLARVIGAGPVFALSYASNPSVLQQGAPLTWSNITVQRLEAGDLFNFESFSALDRFALTYTLTVKDGQLSSSTGSIYGK